MLEPMKSAMAFVVVFQCAGFAAQAAPTLKHSTIEPGRYRVKEVVHPLAPQSITQNEDPNTIVAGTSIACVDPTGETADTGWWRLYDLDQFDLFGEFCTKNVDYGIETAVGPTQNMTVNVWCLDDGLPFLTVFLALAATSSQPQPDAALEFFNIEVAGCCDSGTQSMAVELLSDDCLESETCASLFIGANNLGETGPAYVTAADCGVIDPLNVPGSFFIDFHLIQVVNGNDEGQPDGGDGGNDGGVPATTTTGAVLMVLGLLGTSALFLRRVTSD